MLKYLDPATSVYMTDDPAEGAALSSEEGFFKYPNGLADPVHAKPRIMYVSFRKEAEHGQDARATSALSHGGAWRGEWTMRETPLVKVNQVGYLPDERKFAYLGGWLGPKYGAWRPRPDVSEWRVVNRATGLVVFSGHLDRSADGVGHADAMTGEAAYALEFSSVTNEGVYRVEIPGVGCSMDFRVAARAAEDAFRVHMSGLYHQRCGIAKTADLTCWPSRECHQDVVRGLFPPDEGTLEPSVRYFDIIRDTTDWNDERLHLPGGWHDAADFDRRPMHLWIVNDLAAVYLMRTNNFIDGQLAIPEKANGIPDILDEADWGLRHLLAAQEMGGGVGTWIETTRHPVPGESPEGDPLKYALSRPTRTSSMMYAAHAALLARTHPALRERYLKSAKSAWSFATGRLHAEELTFEVREKRRMLPDKKKEVVWTEDDEVPAVWLVKAAVNLYALTKEKRYIRSAERAAERFRKEAMKHDWRWSPLLFAGEAATIPRESLTPELAKLADWWFERVRSRADKACAAVQTNQYRNPAAGAPRSWGESQPLVLARSLVAAHGATGEAKYLEAACAALDFHNGLNPSGSTLTSGLGKVYPTSFLHLASYTDGIAEYVPGITPYRWTAKIPRRVPDLCYGGDAVAAEAWPPWRRYENFENQTVAASEFTVWETIGPAAAVTGYLVRNPTALEEPPRKPAKRLEDLPGYWNLP